MWQMPSSYPFIILFANVPYRVRMYVVFVPWLLGRILFSFFLFRFRSLSKNWSTDVFYYFNTLSLSL